MALNPTDLFDVRSLLSEEERMIQDSVARFTDERVIPIIGDCFDQGRFPKELVPAIAELGLFGSSLPEKYGCAGLNSVSYGLICQELERGDSGIRSFVSVQSSLCMFPIYAYGTEEQRLKYLPGMARGEIIGYDVDWRYRDKTGTIRMDSKPGERLPVRDGNVVVTGARAGIANN